MTLADNTLSHESNIADLTSNHLALLGKAHRLDVLRTLSKVRTGLTYSQILYDVVRTSSANRVLRDLVEGGLAEKRNGEYWITEDGSDALSLAEGLVELGGG